MLLACAQGVGYGAGKAASGEEGSEPDRRRTLRSYPSYLRAGVICQRENRGRRERGEARLRGGGWGGDQMVPQSKQTNLFRTVFLAIITSQAMHDRAHPHPAVRQTECIEPDTHHILHVWGVGGGKTGCLGWSENWSA